LERDGVYGWFSMATYARERFCTEAETFTIWLVYKRSVSEIGELAPVNVILLDKQINLGFKLDRFNG
jgi:hypothetical protein